MGAFAFAGRKLAGIACGVLGLLFGFTFVFMSQIRAEYQWGGIIGIIVILLGSIFGIYFWRSADRHV